MVFPKDPAFRIEAVLDGKFHRPDRLIRGCDFVPHDAGVLGRVVGGRGAELDFDVVFRRGALEVVEEPVGNLRGWARAGDGVGALVLHFGQNGEEGHVPIIVAEAVGGLRVHRVADHVRIGQHAGRVLLNSIRPQLQCY